MPWKYDREWTDSRWSPVHFTPWEKDAATQWIGGWGPHGHCEDGIKLLLLAGIEPHFQSHSAHGLTSADRSYFSCILWHTISQITCIHFTWDTCSIMYTFRDFNKIKFKQYFFHSHIASHSSNSTWLLYVLI
jgi:hypothetical protein